MKVSILNAGQQTDYLYGLVSGLSEVPSLELEVVDSDNSVGLLDAFPHTTLFNLRRNNPSVESVLGKAWSTWCYYVRLLWYTRQTQSKIFHIQWDNSILILDRTLLILYYKLFGKKLVHTAHNIDKDARDNRVSLLRRISLSSMYHLMDAIIVHTHLMKEELCSLFHIAPEKVFVIPHGINNRIPRRGLSRTGARATLGIDVNARVVLFFGQIDNYKGIENLIDAAATLVREHPDIVLVIAGQPKRQMSYALQLKSRAARCIPDANVIFRFEYIPVAEVETYFAAADCLVLPYKKIFQSGVIFLAYHFGLPIIATDIASFREDIIDGATGFICNPDDAADMAETLLKFFNSDLFHRSEQAHVHIMELAEQKYSWSRIARQTCEVYTRVLAQS